MAKNEAGSRKESDRISDNVSIQLYFTIGQIQPTKKAVSATALIYNLLSILILVVMVTMRSMHMTMVEFFLGCIAKINYFTGEM